MRLAVHFEKHVHVVSRAVQQCAPLAVRLRFNGPHFGHLGKTDVQILRCFALRRLKFQIRAFPRAAAPEAGVFAVVHRIRLFVGRCDDAA